MSTRWKQTDLDRLPAGMVQSKGEGAKAPGSRPKSTHRFVIGIDPGVKTGIAVWDCDRRSFHSIACCSIIHAQNFIKNFFDHVSRDIIIRIEDARKRKWFGKMDKEQAKYGAAVREGAGSVKRDCQIWEEFCLHQNIDFELVAPKDNKTKLDAKLFAAYTGWKERTNEHSRDAAMLVFNT